MGEPTNTTLETTKEDSEVIHRKQLSLDGYFKNLQKASTSQIANLGAENLNFKLPLWVLKLKDYFAVHSTPSKESNSYQMTCLVCQALQTAPKTTVEGNCTEKASSKDNNVKNKSLLKPPFIIKDIFSSGFVRHLKVNF